MLDFDTILRYGKIKELFYHGKVMALQQVWSELNAKNESGKDWFDWHL